MVGYPATKMAGKNSFMSIMELPDMIHISLIKLLGTAISSPVKWDEEF